MSKRREKRDRDEQEARADPFINDDGDGEDIDGEDGPPVIDPYEVLQLDQEATTDEVKKAYRKMALKHHPDKASEGDKASSNTKFQEIAFAYAILSDTRRRQRYDLTGSTAEVMDDADDDFDWLSFYRQQFEDVVNEESMKRIADEYKGSEKEKSDLLAAYTKYKGRFAYIYEAVMLSDILEDDDRFRTIINQAIELGTVESYAAWERENNDEKRQKAKDAERKRKADWDKRQAEKEAQADADATAGASTSKPKAKGRAKKSAGGDMADLQALISQRQRARQGGNFFERLEAKYAQPSGGRGSKRATPMDEGPSDEAFVAMGERKKARTSARGKKSKDVDVDEDMGEDEDIVGSEEISEEDAPKKKRAKKPRKGRGRAKA